jgi:Fe(3+) dicitrate transport protein
MRTPRLLTAAIAASLALHSTVHADDGADGLDDAAAQLDRTVVLGSAEKAQETAGSAQYLDEATLQAFDYTDVHRVLRQVPGVYVIDEEGYGLRPNIGIRGSGTDRNSRITVMEDGVPIAPAIYSAPAAYYFPTMQRMSAVEVRKGSASIRSGPRTTGGVINFLSTPIPAAPIAGRAEVLFGQDSTLLGHGYVGGTGESGFGYLIETVQQHTDGFKRLGGGDTGYDLQDYRVRLGYETQNSDVPYQRVELKIGRTEQDSDETYLGLTDADFRADPQRRYAASQLDNITTEHDQYELRHAIQFNDALDLSTTAYKHEFTRAWYKLDSVAGGSLANVLADPAQFAEQYGWLTGETSPDNALVVRNNNRAYEQQGVQTVLGWALGNDAVGHQLEFGLRWHEDEEDRFQNDDRYRMDDGRMVLTTAGAPGSQTNQVVSADAWALYVQDEIRFGDFILTPGVRYERIDLERLDYSTSDPDRGDGPTRIVRDRVTQTIPGIGLTWQFAESWALFGSVHKGFNPPAPGATAKSEESINTEIGVRFEREALFAEAVAFHNDYDNLVGTCTASTGGGCTIGDQFDGGKARVQGVEVRTSFTFNDGGAVEFPLTANYTWTDAEFRSAFSSGFGEWGTVVPGDELPYLPENLFHAGIGAAGERWNVHLAANYVDAMRTRAGQGAVPPGQRTDSAWIWDLSAGYTISGNFELFGRIENLLDEEYIVARRPAGARPSLPRTALVGFRYAF